MKNSDQLKQDLEAALKIEKYEEAYKEYEKAKLTIGTGKATHKITTYLKVLEGTTKRFSMYYVNNVTFDEEHLKTVYYLETLNITKQPDRFIVDYRENVAYGHLPGTSDFGTKNKYDVSKEDLHKMRHTLFAGVEAVADSITDLINPELQETGGGYSEVRKSVELLLTRGYSFVDVEKAGVLDLLKWNGHPFLYGRLLLFSEDSIAIARRQANNIYSKAISWGGFIQSRDMPRVAKINNFLDSINSLPKITSYE